MTERTQLKPKINYISKGHNSKIVDPEIGFLHVACHFNSFMLANTKDI